MASPNNLLRINKRKTSLRAGFTLLEVMVVMAFIAIIGSFGLIVGMDSYRNVLSHSETSLVVTALQRARSLSIGNTCLGTNCTDGRKHGVKIQPNAYIMFEGNSFATRDTVVDQTIEANPSVTHGGTLNEVVFTQLSGTSTPGTITLTDSKGSVTTITIGSEGQILWSK